MSIRESAVEKFVRQWAKDHGISSLKLASMGDRGKADRLFMRHGKAVFMELKRPGKEATALQEKFLRERREDGFNAECFDNAPHAIQWLRNVFDL